MLRRGRHCDDCIAKVPWRAVFHGCYRGSRAQSAVAACVIQAHRALGTWRDKVDVFIALSEDSRQAFIREGLPDDKIVVKPNFLHRAAPPGSAEREGILFVGRLSPEKGIVTLVNAVRLRRSESPVLVAGSGPEAGRLSGVRGLTQLGRLSPDDIAEIMRRSLAVVVPSVWRETFGMVVIEAFAAGTPVIASRIGALPELVHDRRNGLLVSPGSASELADAIEWIHSHKKEAAQMGLQARTDFERRYTGEENYRQLIAIYDRACVNSRASALPS